MREGKKREGSGAHVFEGGAIVSKPVVVRPEVEEDVRRRGVVIGEVPGRCYVVID
jgi:hypothetical protein